MKKLYSFSSLIIITVFLGFQTFGQVDTVQGHVCYKHFNGNTLYPYTMDSAIVQIKQGAIVIQQTTVNVNGYFIMTNVPAGTYSLSAKCTKHWGGGNSTDVLYILRNFVGIPPLLVGIQLKAADVDCNGAVNAADCLALSSMFTGGGYVPPCGKWVFENFTTTVVPGTNINQLIYGLCVGDVNGSYIPLNSHHYIP